jgi:Xaa-Pro aminopeptidase
MDERLARTIEALRETGADWAILSSPDSIAYALGYAPPVETGVSSFAAGPNIAIVGRDGAAGILAPDGEAAEAREGITARYDGYRHMPSSPPEAVYLEAFKALIGRLGVGGGMATEPGTLPALIEGNLPGTVRKPGLARALRRQRMTKTAAEIESLRRAAEVTATGQRQFLHSIQAGISELQLFSEIRAAMESAAGERIAVAGDLLSGRERTAAVWGWPSGRKLERGDAVLADIAPRLGAYWGDSCATTVLGAPSDGQMRLFAAVRQALELAVAALRPAMTADAAHRLIHDSIRGAGFDYRHHSGHGIGTAVHEHPRLAPGETEMLRAGMVLMVEPGAYDPVIGGARVEWMLHVTETGCLPMAPFPLASDIDR